MTGEESGRSRADQEEELFAKLEKRLEGLGVLSGARRMHGPTERSMMTTLAARGQPLADAQDFPAAHRELARGLESLMFNAKEPPSLPARLGPVRTVLTPLVSVVATWIQSGQTQVVVRDVGRLYLLREANSVWGSPEHVALRRARLQLEALRESAGTSLGLPVFLLSGAFVSGLLGIVRAVVVPALASRWWTAALLALVLGLLLAIAAAFLMGASIAKMRLRLALVAPLERVYRDVGSTGPRPRDKCYQVALVALGLFAIAVLVVPGGVYLLVTL